MINPDLVVVTGPLSPFRDGFGSWLETAGYSREMRAEHLRLMAGLSRWLEERGEASGCLGRPLLAEFLAGRRAARSSTGRSITGMRPLVEYLRAAGAAPPDEPAPSSGPAEEAIAEYASYLRSERGLAAATVERETALIRGQHNSTGPSLSWLTSP